MDYEPTEIALRIRQRREELGLTQRDLAKLLGVSKSTPGAWEAGRASVRQVLWSRIADVLQTTEGWLQSGRHESRTVAQTGKRPDEQLLLSAYNSLPPELRRLLLGWAEAVVGALRLASGQGQEPEFPPPPAVSPTTPQVAPELAPDPPRSPASTPRRGPGGGPGVAMRVPRSAPSDGQTSAPRGNQARVEGLQGAGSEPVGELVPLRFLGDIAAGLPAHAWRQGDEMPVPAALLQSLPPGVRAGVLKVSGDSMAPTLERGDLVVVREAAVGQYRKGDVVVALIDGEETTLKRYAGQRSGVITLQADNPEYGEQRYEPGRVVVQATLLANFTRETGDTELDIEPL